MTLFSKFLIFAALGSLTYSICYRQTKVEMYIIPPDYRVKIVVEYKRPFRSDSKSSKDTTFYYIPNDGIALAQNNIKTTQEKNFFVTFDNTGKKKDFAYSYERAIL